MIMQVYYNESKQSQACVCHGRYAYIHKYWFKWKPKASRQWNSCFSIHAITSCVWEYFLVRYDRYLHQQFNNSNIVL